MSKSFLCGPCIDRIHHKCISEFTCYDIKHVCRCEHEEVRTG